MGEGDDDPMAGVREAAQLGLRLGEPAGRYRRALGLERVRLALRERVDLRDRGELQRAPGNSSLQTWRTSSGRQTRSGPSGSAGRGRRELPLCGRPPAARLGQVEAALRGRPDRRAFDRVQRALREGRERADALDLVAEELDAQRLAAGGRVDVDDPSPERELAALLHPVDALVACEGEVLGERVDPRLLADLEAERLGTCSGRRHALSERGRGRDHEAASGEDVQRPVPLADEVRRRR